MRGMGGYYILIIILSIIIKNYKIFPFKYILSNISFQNPKNVNTL